jgi:hypothetical protein
VFRRFCYPLYTPQLNGHGPRSGNHKAFIVVGKDGAVVGGEGIGDSAKKIGYWVDEMCAC